MLKRKLMSRKFWSLLIALAIAIMTALNVEPNTSAHIVSLIGAFGSVIGYMLAQGIVDSNGNNNGE